MTNRESVVSLARQGMPPREIATELQVSTASVYAHIRAARKSGADIPYFKPGAPRGTPSVPIEYQISLGPSLFRLLEGSATRKRLTPQELGRKLIEQALLGASELSDA